MPAIHAPHRLALAVVLSLVAVPCLAEDPGAYVTLTAGLTGQRDQTLDFRSAGSSARGDAGFDSGFLGGGAVGYRFGNGWRVEGEFTYQTVDHDGRTFAAVGPSGAGNYASTSVAINGLYEFDLLGSARARTYVGAGLVYLTEVDIDFEQGSTERSFSGNGNGVQLLAGARYDLGERWFLDAGLRYLAASGLDLEEESGGSGRIEADYAPWAATIGVGWRF
jgi:opacity protein-like surface antigen